MIRPDSILLKTLPIPPKLNINKHIVIVFFLGVIIFLSLVFVSYLFKIDKPKLIYVVLSSITSICYLIFDQENKRNE